MNIYSAASLIAATFCISLGVFVYTKRRWDRKCRLFGVAGTTIGLWTLFPFALSIASNEQLALLFARITYIPAILTPPIWLHFMLTVARERPLNKIERVILTFAYLTSVPFILFIFSPLFIRGTVRFAPYFAVLPGPLYPVYILVFSIIIMFTIFFMRIFSNLKTLSGYYKNRFQLILIAFAIGVLAGLMHFSTAYFGKELFPHDFLIIIYTALFAYGIIKYRLMDIPLAITRAGIFMAVYTILLGVPFAIAAYYQNHLIAIFGAKWWMLPSGLMAISATVGPSIYIYLESKAEKRLFFEQHKYQETLKQAAREMARIHNFRKLLNLIVHIVTKTVHISYSAIYLFDQSSSKYIMRASRNLKKAQPGFIEKEDQLSVWFQNNREPIVYEEINLRAQEAKGGVFAELEGQMRALNAAVIVPGFLDERLLGMLILSNKRSGKIYTIEDLNTFSLLANQAVLAVENAILYENIEEQVKQRTKELVETQKQLIQAEKLATVGTLAGGVAHEINNPLTAILTNVQMLLSEKEMDLESLELIEEATKRCRTIVQKLMAYAKKPMEAAKISEVNLLEISKNLATFLKFQLEQENVKIIIDAKDNEYLVTGNQNELEQVITNVILNARDAIRQVKKEGDIQISFLKSSDLIKMKIKDEGAGIPKEIIVKIFDPFFTTKDVGKGTGLGLSICQSIIEKHKGLITVESSPGSGSVFTVQLPKAKKSAQEVADGKKYSGN